mgnify:CR=1 FL=1
MKKAKNNFFEKFANRAGTKINVKATDLPGNVAEESVEL